MSFSRSAARFRDQLCGRSSLTRSCLPNETNVPGVPSMQAPTSRSSQRDAMPRSPSPILWFQLGFPKRAFLCTKDMDHSDPAIPSPLTLPACQPASLLLHLRASPPSDIEKLQPHPV